MGLGTEKIVEDIINVCEPEIFLGGGTAKGKKGQNRERTLALRKSGVKKLRKECHSQDFWLEMRKDEKPKTERQMDSRKLGAIGHVQEHDLKNRSGLPKLQNLVASWLAS